MKDLKYLAAYTIPLSAAIGLLLKGYWSYLTPLYAFGLIPLLELLMPLDPKNESVEEKERKKSHWIFDWMLYLNVPIVYGLLFFTLYDFTTADYRLHELIGCTLSLGIVLGSNGINVGHELGHRQNSWERYLGKLLLLPSFYMHFYIEHNYGHHFHVATPEDPASAKYNQSVYSFWVTSVFGQYGSALRLQEKMLTRAGKGFLSAKNDLFWYVLIQFIYLMGVFFVFDLLGVFIAIAAGVVGFLLLETVNYIEHYGLSRKKLASGRYERVSKIHSWNSNHIVGRIVLYELTRHSDHHYKSAKKYQLLDCHELSPQMPYGYPTSMVLSLFPPLWFAIMNPRIPEEMRVVS